MDPSIMKILEEDEDETMHSGADVDAFTTALNRDIEGDNSISQPSDSDNVPVEIKQEDQASRTNNQQAVGLSVNNQQSMGIGMNNQQQSSVGPGLSCQQAINALNRGKQVPFALLLPVIQPQLEKDRALQLETLYQNLKKNEISRDEFVRHMRSIVGDQMLKMAVYKLQTQARSSRTVPNQQQMHAPSNETSNSSMYNNNNNNVVQHREVEQISSSSQERDRPGPGPGLSPGPGFPVQGLSKQQQQHLHFSQSSFQTYGSAGPTSNYHHFRGSNINTSAASSMRPQVHDSQIRQIPTSSQSMNMMNVNAQKFERPNTFNEPKRMQSGNIPQGMINAPSSIDQQRSLSSTPQSLSSFPSNALTNANTGTLKEESFDMQSARPGFSSATTIAPLTSSQMDHNHPVNSRIPSMASSAAPSNNAKTPPKKPSIGPKKPLETLVSSPPNSSKKPKVSGGFADQIDQLNDVTAVSGVNLKVEEEQLFSATKDETRVSEASRKVMQEEEEKLILEKIPLQKKLAEIIAKSGLQGVGSDVEKCLSLCVEERMRGLMTNLIRVSKQRADIEKSRHRNIVTSDVRQQIMAINRTAREEWDKKQADAEKLQRLNDPDGNSDGDKDKDDGRGRLANKEEDNKTRATAANVAARAAFGGDDMLSKWQLMAEQARQKREGGPDITSSSNTFKDVTSKSSSTSGKNVEKRGLTGSNIGTMRKAGKNQGIAPENRVARTISVKDVIAVLEREPQMSRTTFMYRLYEKVCEE